MRAIMFALALIWSQLAVAKTQIVEATGHGSNRQEATAAALTEAVAQVNGAVVDGTQILQSTMVSGGAESADGQETNFSFNITTGQSVNRKASGVLRRYHIVSVRQVDVGIEVKIRAEVEVYDAPGLSSDTRRKLAILPFRISMQSTQVAELSDPYKVSEQLTAGLSSALVGSRRFAILERSEDAELTAERARWSDSNASVTEAAKLGRELGADYLVLGKISAAKGGVQTRELRATGRVERKGFARFEVEIKVVIPATGQIKYFRQELIDLNDPSLNYASAGAITARVGQLLAARLTEGIYPLRVVEVSNGVAVLNQGGDSMKVGETLLLVSVGAELKDPYTGEPLGGAETPLGNMRVNRVDAKLSYAQLDQQAKAAIRKGMTVKRVETSLAGKDARVPAPTPRTQGVKLPWE